MKEAENAVLACCLHDPDLARLVASEMSVSDFMDPANVATFQAILAIVDRQHKVDLPSLISEGRLTGKLDAMGGVAHLAGLDVDLPDTLRLPQYIDLVRRASSRARMIDLFADAKGIASDPETSLEAVAQKVTRMLREELDHLPGWEPGEIDNDIEEALRAATSGTSGAFSTGFPALDEMTSGGFRRGELILIAGRPGMGKTILSQAIALSAAQQNLSVAVANFEMTKVEQMHRLLASHCRIPLSYLRSGHLKSYDVQRVNERRAWLRSLKLWHLDSRHVPATLAGALSLARRVRRGPGLDVLHLDTVNLMTDRGHESRQLEVAAISRSLKALAQEAQIAIVLCCQLNREPMRTSDKRPHLHDLKESGALEQDADLAMFLHREIVYDPSADPQTAEILVRKNRNGETGMVRAVFSGAFVRLEAA